MNGSAHNRFPDVEAGRGAAAQRTGGKRANAQITLVVNAPPTLQITAPADGALFAPGETITFMGACGLTFFSDHPFSIYGTPVERAVKDNEPASGKGRADRLPDRPVE